MDNAPTPDHPYTVSNAVTSPSDAPCLLCPEPKAAHPNRCKPCTRGDHARCVGLSCLCADTPRCASNALLTLDREVSP